LPILTDTSFFIAAARSKDSNHEAAVRTLRKLEGAELAMPVTILAESMGLVGSRSGVFRQRQVWDMFRVSGIEVVPVGTETLDRAREIDERYADAGFGFADCTLLAVCEELRTARILSFDRRLAAYRPSFAPSLEVLP
jgi:predicted nucleic acid-binding protein